MEAILTRTADLPAVPAKPSSFRKRLSALALAYLNRLASPPRDVPVEYYRFPPF